MHKVHSEILSPIYGKKDACVMWYTHIKTLAYAVWLSKQALLNEGGSELGEINELTTLQLLTLMFWEKSSGATGCKQKQDEAEQQTQCKK